MQHPLVRPSLAPYGFVFPFYRDRLDYRPNYDEFYINPERHIAKFWAEIHRIDQPRPWPIETIIHEIMPGMATANRLSETDFEFGDKPYFSRDILVISSVVYWFGTNCGSAFLHIPEIPAQRRKGAFNHLEKFQKLMSETDMVDRHWTGEGAASVRDYALAEAVMRWLDRRAGKDTIAAWENKLRTANQEMSRLRLAKALGTQSEAA